MREHSPTTVRKLIWLSPLALLTFAGTARAADPTSDEPSAPPECKNAGVTVGFAPGSAEIDKNGLGALAGVATWMQNGDQRTVRLEGYADKSGSKDANQRLSEKRTQAAKDFLLGRGIASDRIMVFGHGEQEDRSGADARVVTVTACDTPKEVGARAPEPKPPEAEPQPPPAPEPAPTAEAAPPAEPLITPVTEVPPPPPARTRPPSVIGMEATIGGGVVGFIDDSSKNVAKTGGSWDARLMFGSRLPIAVEAAYVGSAQSIEALGLSTDSLLVGHGIEGMLRINLTTARVQPYLFGGAGYTRYALNNTSTNTSSVLGHDDIGTVPLGVGLTGRLGRGFILDVRGTYRATFNDDMLRSMNTDENSLQSWNASGRVGFEF
jgi:hypothetical protein